MSGQEYVPLRLVPVSMQDARRYVVEHHRHNDPPPASVCRVAVAVKDGSGVMRGVGILGRPTSIGMEDGRTAEVRRVATDGCPNASSMIYGALVRAAWALGYDRVLTYTLASEPGTSLRAAGWTCDGLRKYSDWERPNIGRLRTASKPTLFFEAKHPTEDKVRWVIERHRRALA